MADEIKIKVVVDDNQAVAGLKTTQKELAAVAATAVKADSSLDSLGKSIAPVATGLKKAGTSAATASQSIGAMAANVSDSVSGFEDLAGVASIAQIGLASIGVAVLAGAAALVEYITRLSTAAQAQRDLSASLNESAASVQGNVARLEILVGIAKDVTRSDNERKEALGALNKEYDGFNKSLTLANINTEASTDLIRKQTAAIVRQAQIKGLENLITKESEKQADLLSSKLEDNITLYDKAKIALSGGIFGTGAGITTGVTAALENINNGLKTSNERIEIFKEQLKNLLGEDAFEGTLFSEKTAKEKAGHVKKAIETIDDVLAKLGRQIDFLNTKELAFGINETKAKIAAIKSTIEKLITDFKVSPDSTIIAKLFGDIQGTFDRFLERVPDINVNVKTSTDIKEQIDKDYKEAQDLLGKNPLIIKAKISVGGSEIGQFEKLRDVIQQINKDTAKTVNGILNIGNAFTSIGESIGESLASGANLAETIFGNIFKILGAGLQELGKGMIAIATAKIVLEQFTFAPGIFTLLAGIAAVAAGGLLKTIKLPGFAGGVENFSGGLALVGERGPELVNLPRGSDVIPNHRLGGISGGSQQIEVVGRLVASGNSLVAVIDGARRTNSRNGQG